MTPPPGNYSAEPCAMREQIHSISLPTLLARRLP
jgi:hypothetical protein